MYAAETGDLLCRLPIFSNQPVHGIHVKKSEHPEGAAVLVWGSSSIAVFPAARVVESSNSSDAEIAGLVTRATAPDWIYDGAISPFDASAVVLATAHNEIVPARYSAEAGQIELGSAVAPSRPMLYAAHLTWIAADCVLMAGGTVFGDVVVWKYHPQAKEKSGQSETLFVFSGHEGSIFGVDISPLTTLPNGSTARLLASCSDDRTIRIWDITEHQAIAPDDTLALKPKDVVRPAKPLETGFRHGDDNYQDGDSNESQENSAEPIAVVMGHASRIWSVKFSPVRGGDTLAVYSFGEDSTTQRWRLDLDSCDAKLDSGKGNEQRLVKSAVRGEMGHDRTFSLHNGKHLWSNAVLVQNDALHIATGGADSQIYLIEEPLDPFSTGSSSLGDEKKAVSKGSVVTLDVHDILKSLPSPQFKTFDGRELVGRYDFLQDSHILVTTSAGRLFLGSLQENSVPEWQEISVAERMAADLTRCYVLKAVGDGAAIIGTTSGNIYYFQLSSQSISHVASLDGRVVEISCLSIRSTIGCPDISPVEVLVHLHGLSEPWYLKIDTLTGALQSQEQIKGLDSRFVATSAARIGDLLVIGSRHGWLSFLERNDDGIYRPVFDTATRSRDAITAILSLPPKSSEPRPVALYILATSRDGKYRIYEIDRREGSFSIHLRHETSPPFGPMIEGAWFTTHTQPELILYGFRSKDFVIWNESRREALATIECGGAHRTFRLAYNESDLGSYRLAFTKTSRLSLFSTERITHRSVKSGTHGREIRALSSNGNLVATGAEDTSIRIWEYRSGKGRVQAEMQYLACMKMHVTGLQRLQWLGEDYLFSSAGNEEFFVWRVQRLDSEYLGLAVYCEGVLTDKSPVGDLRIMDFDVCRAVDDDKIIIITMIFSNSTLKTYRYTSGDGSFDLFAEGYYTGACLTQIRYLGIYEGQLSILTASTDGHIAVWETSSGEDPVQQFSLKQTSPLHQSSIKSLDMMRGAKGYHIVTGGDDNALGVILLGQVSGDSTSTGGWKVLERGIVRRAHAAAINGVAIVKRDMDVIAISVSNDQRVKTWRILGCGGRKGIEMLGNEGSGVADPGDVALVDDGAGSKMTMVIGGVGIEAWNVADGRTSVV